MGVFEAAALLSPPKTTLRRSRLKAVIIRGIRRLTLVMDSSTSQV